ncbi:MAG: hypothetical protein ABSA29_04365 [Terriglobales bacterium]|jgi:hypothetical protein
MKGFTKLIFALALVTLCAASTFATTKYVVDNDDNPTANTATFYTVGTNGKLTLKKTVPTGGTGLGGGYFADARINVSHSKTQPCVYVSNATSNNVSAINEETLKNNGPFKAGTNDSGAAGGITVVSTTNYVYAGFSGATAGAGEGSIATYKEEAGCKLKYVKSIPAKGLGQGTFGVGQPTGMAITPDGKTMVVGYDDGSIQSFNVSAGVPKPIGKAVNTTGFADGDYPGSVDITKDGKYAIFGDITSTSSSGAIVEVGEIATLKNGKTKVYGPIQTGFNSNFITLSPDESLVYISNNQGGTITAAAFNKTSGVVSATKSCMSAVLSGFGTDWFYAGGLTTENTQTGNGTAVYVGELGFPGEEGESSIGQVNVKSSGSGCTLTEAKGSPYANPTGFVMSVGSYPPRPF